ncbi:MAG: DUF2142 domain-containing protein [Deltaproteobacteria bacterium]|nr:DUF2142 domain-containing protein [Deltaproteobacteria bacterium]
MTTLGRDRARSGAASYPAQELASASVTAHASSCRVRIADVIETRLPWLFLSYALPAVVVLSIIMAPFQVADELAHIERADQISRGKMISDRTGGAIDAGWDLLEPVYHRMWFHPEVKQTVVQARETGAIRWSEVKEYVNFQDTARYGPFLYVPQVIAVLFGRLADLRLIQTLVAARLLNGFAACVVGFVALTICRCGRALTFTTLLLPMTLSQFASASQDALSISLSIVAIAMASQVLAERRAASTAEFAVFACIVVAT